MHVIVTDMFGVADKVADVIRQDFLDTIRPFVPDVAITGDEIAEVIVIWRHSSRIPADGN